MSDRTDSAHPSERARTVEGLLSPPDPAQLVIESHLADCRRRNLRPSTIYQRGRVLARLADWTKCTDPRSATREQLESYFSRPLTPDALACEMTHLNQFYIWAVNNGYMAENPAQGFKRPKIPKRLPRPISDEELTKAMATAPKRVKPWLYLAAYAGFRAAEIGQLRAEALRLDDTPALAVIEDSKGGGMSSVPLHPRLVEVLKACDLPTSGYLFLRGDGQPGPNKPWTISHLSNNYLHSIGIDSTLHSLRHWFGTNAYKATKRDLRMTQELMRHSSPVTTSLYTFVDPGETAVAVADIPVIG